MILNSRLLPVQASRNNLAGNNYLDLKCALFGKLLGFIILFCRQVGEVEDDQL
jgi:hypothetical protein